jgi:hypothetical protein
MLIVEQRKCGLAVTETYQFVPDGAANVLSLNPATDSSSLGALFDLLGVILPGNKTEDDRREREAFLRQTFSGLASVQSKLVAVVEQSGKDWSRTPENIIRELARGDLRL